MKTCTRCKETKSLSNFAKRTASKDGLAPTCSACKSEVAKARYAADEDFRSKALARVKQQDPESRRTMNRSWYARNAKSHSKQVYLNTRAKKDASPAWRNAWNVWTRMTTTKRVLDRSTFEQTLVFYDLAYRAGDIWVVDHIIPLNGETVCGLHVPSNLQLLTKTRNQLKSNSFDGVGLVTGVLPL